MFTYISNVLYNLSDNVVNYIETIIIDFYNSITVIPEEEIEMTQVDYYNNTNVNNIISAQPLIR